MNFRGSSQL